MKDARYPWIENAHPLVDLRMTRRDCLLWFRQHYPRQPLTKSACVGCPYHSNREWLRIYRSYPEEAQRAIELDERLRDPERVSVEPNPRVMNYLHPSRRPLAETLERLDYLDRLQPHLMPEEESASDEMCGGHCYT